MNHMLDLEDENPKELTGAQRLRLNPEQMAIAEQWLADSNRRLARLDSLSAQVKAGEITQTEMFEILKEDHYKEPTHCAHDRSMMGTCAECDEIERLLWPEHYCKVCEEACNKYMNPMGENGICKQCEED